MSHAQHVHFYKNYNFIFGLVFLQDIIHRDEMEWKSTLQGRQYIKK